MLIATATLEAFEFLKCLVLNLPLPSDRKEDPKTGELDINRDEPEESDQHDPFDHEWDEAGSPVGVIETNRPEWPGGFQ